MIEFETERLLGISLNPKQYLELENKFEPKWEGFANPFKHLLTDPGPLIHRIPRVKINPGFATIGILFAVQKSTKIIIGSAGFHDFPDAAGMIEIGFSIVPQFQNQGYGKEILLGMWRWIVKRADVKILRYTVSPKNAPSLHIINTIAGFSAVGEQIDPEDGLEIIYEMASEEFSLRYGIGDGRS